MNAYAGFMEIAADPSRTSLPDGASGGLPVIR